MLTCDIVYLTKFIYAAHTEPRALVASNGHTSISQQKTTVMDAAIKRLPTTWEALKLDLEDRLAMLQTEEPKVLKMATKAILVCTEMIQVLQGRLLDYAFSPGEEIQFYKDIKPFFLCRLIFYNRLYELEIQRTAVGSTGTEKLLLKTLDDLAEVCERHRFIHRYLKSGATYLDDKLFFHPTAQSAVALFGVDFPSECGFPACYDHVVAHLLAVDLLRTYVEQALEDGRVAGVNVPGLPRITWTDSKTALIELVYALHAAGVFNNGKIDLKDVIEFVETSFHIDLGHYPRTFQEILSRKTGYTNALDRYRDKLLLRIQKIEEKYDR